MRPYTAAISILAYSACAYGQPYTINTFAGGGLPVNVPGTSASLWGPQSAAADAAGNVYFADGNHVVLRWDATTGIVTLAAGNGTPGYTGDNGPATSAQLRLPYGVAVDSAGNLYIADLGNDVIREVSNGVITTVAGINGQWGYAGDGGLATCAGLSGPYGVAVDSAGDLYIADTYNHRIRKVANGVISTIAGTGVKGFSGDGGLATGAQLNEPYGVGVDAAGNLYIADTGNSRVREVANGVITTVAGNGTQGFSGDDGSAANAELNGPSGVAVDSAGGLYIADANNDRIRKVVNGVIVTVAGTGIKGYNGDFIPAAGAWLGLPADLSVDPAGNLYIADTAQRRIRRIANGIITTVVGDYDPPVFIGGDGPAASAELNYPYGIALGPDGSLYIAEYYGERVRKVAMGMVTTVAGIGILLTDTGQGGFHGDGGPATTAEVTPEGIAVDAAGDVYVSDTPNNRVRKISNGVITTMAGIGTPGYNGDGGPATGAQLYGPAGLALDSAGDLYIADVNNNAIRKVSNGAITTVAGNGVFGYGGDNGPATSAQLAAPSFVAVDAAGNLFIADAGNNRVREVSNGVISTIAGNGTPTLSGDGGPATSAGVFAPEGIALDAAGNLYIADAFNVRKVSNGVISTIAGDMQPGFTGDGGPALSATLNMPFGVAADFAGNVYIADSNNDRIRMVTVCRGRSVPPPSSLSGSLSVAVQADRRQPSRPCERSLSQPPPTFATHGARGAKGAVSGASW